MTSPLEPVETEDTLSDTERKAVEKIVEREIREAHAPSLFTQIANTVAVLFFFAALGLVGWLVYEALRAGGLV